MAAELSNKMTGEMDMHGVSVESVKVEYSELCNTYGNNEEKIKKIGSSEHELDLDNEQDEKGEY